MYNASFGDCFMIVFPAARAGERPRKVLVDCGSTGVVERVLEDARQGEPRGGGPRLDVVIATHRHADHVRGFGDGAWRGVTVGEVWLPWTEDPHDDEARYIRALQSSRRDELIDQLRHQDPPDQETVEAALGSLLNDEAMETLRTGLLGEPEVRYLPGPPANEEETESERQGRFTLASEALPGIRVSILGPSRLRAVISKGNPPKRERFLRLFGGLPHAAALAAHEARQREALLELRAESGQAAASTDGKPRHRFRPPLFGPD